MAIRACSERGVVAKTLDTSDTSFDPLALETLEQKIDKLQQTLEKIYNL